MNNCHYHVKLSIFLFLLAIVSSVAAFYFGFNYINMALDSIRPDLHHSNANNIKKIVATIYFYSLSAGFIICKTVDELLICLKLRKELLHPKA